MVPFHWMFLMFAAFILFCGFGHLLEAFTYYNPMYRFSGFWKFLTALISFTTAICLIPIVPKILNFTGVFFSILRLMPDGIIVTDATGKVIISNERFNKIFGYNNKSIQEKSIFSIIPELPTNLANNKSETPIETVGIVNEKLTVPIEITFKEILSEKEPLYTIIIRDITQRKKIHEELVKHKEHLELLVLERTQKLMQGESLLKAVLDSIPDLIFFKNEKGTYVECNKAFIEFFGKRKSDVVKKTDKEIFPDDFCELSEKEENLVLKKFKKIKKEESLKSAEQQHFHFETIKVPCYDLHGNLMGLIGISRNITERKQQEKLLQETMKKAEKANITKSAFLANMSHEIRTPMNGIMGFIEILLRTELSYEQHNYLVKMRGVSRSLLGIINDILDFSKIEAGKLLIEDISFFLDDIVEEIVSQFAKVAYDKNLDFIVDLHPDVPVSLIGDPLRLRQILINLISNSLKFTETGEVTIIIDKIKESKDNATLLMIVEDTGIGIPQEKLDILFTPFDQVDGSYTRKYGGTGLGLSISFQLLNLMGGTIRVESEYQKGSKFSVELPIKKQKKETRRSLRRNNMGGHHALIIDKHKKHGYLVERMLRYFGFHTNTIKHLDEVKTLPNKKFHVVIWSSQLLEQNGSEIVSCINSYAKLKDISIVLLVNFTEQKMENHPQIKAVLSKPVSMSNLFDTMTSVLGRSIASYRIKEDIWFRKGPNVLQGTKVLLVEDNEINQEVARELLQTAGIEVTIANHGKEALTLLEKKVFDIILMDVQMPEMDGYETTLKIRSNSHCQKLPIIAMTAHAMSGDKDKCIEVGMSDYITKPIDPEHLFSTLIKWIVIEEKEKNFDALQLPEVLKTKESLILKLDSVTKIDAQEFFQRLGGNRVLFYELLQKFISNYQDTNTEIQKHINESNYEMALKIIHTLKGVSGNISAKSLEKMTTKLESEIKYKNDIKKNSIEESLQLFHIEFNATINEISDFLEKSMHENSQNVTAVSVKTNDNISFLMKNLELNLNKFIPKKCLDILVQIKFICDDSLMEDLNEIEKYIRKYRAKEAKQLLAKILKKINH